jgi:hypothetical protein
LTEGENKTKIRGMPSPPQAIGRAASHAAGRTAAGHPDDRLGRLLLDLGGLGAHLHRGEAPSPVPIRRPTGLAAVDALLGGGFPEGRLSEITGPAGSGRTSLALALLARTTADGALAAVVDPADALDPPSARAAGVALERVLWVRARSVGEALRGSEQVLEAGGFTLVLLDLAGSCPGTGDGSPEVSTAAWSRLRRKAAAGSTSLVVMGQRRLAGPFADLAVALEGGRPRFLPGPAWLAGVDSRLCLVRNRSGPDGGTLGVGWRLAGGEALMPCTATPSAAPRRIQAA